MGLRKAERPRSEALLPAISPQTMESFLALALGFAIAGMSANGYRLFGEHFPSFRLWNRLNGGAFCRHPSADAFRPVFIMRNTVRGSRIERRRFKFVMMPPSLPACGA
jgi:hypothetical protein